MKTPDLQPDADGRVRCSAWLGGVEQLRESWAAHALWLEAVSAHSPGLFGDCQRLQAATLRRCITELGALALEVKEAEYAGTEIHERLAERNAEMNRGIVEKVKPPNAAGELQPPPNNQK